MQDETTHRDPQRRAPKWHRVYYLLAGFDVLIVLLSLFLNYQLLQIYDRSATVSREWTERRNEIDELGKLASAVNAPGNNVFDTHHVDGESSEMRNALDAFNQQMANTEKNLLLQVHKSDGGFEFAESDVRVLSEHLLAVRASMTEMTDEAELIFSYFRRHQPEMAGRRMATMDQKYAALLSSCRLLRGDVTRIQDKLFQHQVASGQSLRRFEFLIATLVLIMVSGATFYGHKIKKQMESNARERESHVLSLQTEIAERRQAEEAQRRLEIDLEKARDVAIESARLKSEFLANMSHEIRTPMNGVIGMAGLLLDTELSSEQREFAETIRSSGDMLLTIINDILDFSKIEAGKLQFETLDFTLANAVEDTIELLATRAHEKQLELISLIYRDVPTGLRGDPGRLRQVLTNLIGNAIKFTEHGEVVVRAEKESEDDSHVVIRFSVSDTGIGIDEAAANRLFQPFIQADGSTTRKYGGTGLGLAISRQLVELMNGRIGLKSAEGKGSTFWFTAKFGKQTEPIDTSPPDLGSFKGLHALIVDDNITNRKILSHQLEACGMVYEEAASGARALRTLRAAKKDGRPYALAIIDLMMPGMDGLELVAKIKADSEISNTRLVLLTSYGQRGDSELAGEAGIAAYLTKPVRQAALLECLARVVNEQGSAREDSVESVVTVKQGRAESAPSLHKLILVAEDNVVNQKVAMRQLLKLGYRADAVANGKEVLEALGRIPYDLVLMDCQMPEMDGYEATAEIRRRQINGRHTPIIAMTANALEGDRSRCIAAGMDDYVSKPVKPEELGNVLQRFLAV